MARKTDSVAIQMNLIIEEFSDKVNKTLKTVSEEVAEESVTRLKSKSPSDSGDYASGWTVKKESDGYVVHNSDHYQLTHLLENGHVIKNKYGEYGRWEPPRKHIKPVESWANREFQKRIERELSE